MDFVRYILVRVSELAAERIELSDAFADVLNLAEREVKLEFGGERIYIARTIDQEVMQSASRNNAIRRAWKTGEPTSLIAERHGLHPRTVRRIARGEY
jgi:hypothetical protein